MPQTFKVIINKKAINIIEVDKKYELNAEKITII